MGARAIPKSKKRIKKLAKSAKKKKPVIDATELFDEWAINTWIEYASYTDRYNHRIRFKVNLLGYYRVWEANKILYSGQSFYEAKKVFDELQG